MRWFLFFVTPKEADAHCDTLDGPVIKAARRALDEGNPNRVLIWIKKEDEDELLSIFKKAMKVRKLNNDAQDLADNYFFENIVRIHRAGEGASYTGLKPAGSDIGPVLPLVDHAFIDGDISKVLVLMPENSKTHVQETFNKIFNASKFDPNNVEGGREFVEGYVMFAHHVQALYNEAHPESAVELEGEDHHHTEAKHTETIEHKEASEKSVFPMVFLSFAGGLLGGLGITKLKKFF